MNISSNEAEEALATIQRTTQKTRYSLTSSSAYIFLIIAGIIWLVGFLSTQFLSGEIVLYIWIGIGLFGCALSVLLSIRIGRRVRGPLIAVYGKRIGFFWLVLAFYCVAAIAIARPMPGKQLTMFIILFIMIGQMAMGLLISFSSTWWALPITALALVGYFTLPGIFFLWMAILGGGGMITLALYIRSRW